MNSKITYAALASLGALVFGIFACSEDADETTTSQNGGPGSGATSTTSQATADASVGVGVGGSSTGQGGSCADVVVEASTVKNPADIIFMVDNSGSMTDENAAIEQNINVNFAAIMGASGVDYQVIMITDHGSSPNGWENEICVGPPLSATTDCSGPPQFVQNKFYHYDINVQSWDSVCHMFDSMFGNEADQWNLAPNGWNAWLRTQAVKVFVEITDDQMGCQFGSTYFDDGGGSVTVGQQGALDFDTTLLQLNPGQFGTVADRNYLFYSIVGLPSKTNPLDPYTEFEPVVTGNCNSAWSPGTAYQWLSKGTGALRFPVCNYQSYDAVFQDIAAGVIDVTSVPCEFDVPEPPPGQMLDLDTVDVLYTPGGMGTTQTW
ncbi:MAG TPA: hypothetical protein VFB62_12115, partial [Polyangiaceae bacterium]|nr:hypothetical protein [Polyangiaceae bacterium]